MASARKNGYGAPLANVVTPEPSPSRPCEPLNPCRNQICQIALCRSVRTEVKNSFLGVPEERKFRMPGNTFRAWLLWVGWAAVTLVVGGGGALLPWPGARYF